MNSGHTSQPWSLLFSFCSQPLLSVLWQGDFRKKMPTHSELVACVQSKSSSNCEIRLIGTIKKKSNQQLCVFITHIRNNVNSFAHLHRSFLQHYNVFFFSISFSLCVLQLLIMICFIVHHRPPWPSSFVVFLQSP